MNIKILGSGCPGCNRLEANAKEAAANLALNATFTKITDISEMMSYGIMSTPALVKDNKVLSAGRELSVKQIEELLSK